MIRTGKIRLSLSLSELGYLHYEENEDVLRHNPEKLEDLIAFRDTILSKFAENSQSIQTEISEYPNIGKPSSQYDAIIKVLSTAKEPMNSNEMHSVLKMKAYHMDIKSLCSRLTDLTRRGKIRRIKKNTVYAYVLA